MNNLLRCPECGSQIEMVGGTNRVCQYKRGIYLKIPDEFLIPTCEKCGEEVSIPEVTEELYKILEQDYQLLIERIKNEH